jgi:hypothetical protein
MFRLFFAKNAETLFWRTLLVLILLSPVRVNMLRLIFLLVQATDKTKTSMPRLIVYAIQTLSIDSVKTYKAYSYFQFT